MYIVEVADIGRGVPGLVKLPALLEAFHIMAPLLHVLLGVVVGAALEVEVRDAEHVAMVRERHSRHIEIHGPLHHGRYARRAVEKREVRVVMKMYERHLSLLIGIAGRREALLPA